MKFSKFVMVLLIVVYRLFLICLVSFCSIVCDKFNGSFKNIGLREGYNIKFVAERVNTDEDRDVDVQFFLMSMKTNVHS